MLGSDGFGERSGEIYLPYVGHVADNAVLLRDGSVMAMGHVEGMAFELEEPVMRNARCRNFNTLLRNMADDNVTISTHLIRHPDVPELPPGRFRSDFSRNLDRAYRERVLNGKLYRNDYFISLIVAPRNVLGKMGGKIARLRKGSTDANIADMIRALEDLWHVVENGLEPHGLRRLGLREKNDVTFTEIGEALRLIMSYRVFCFKNL